MVDPGTKQIVNQLKADKVLTQSAYRALHGIKIRNKKPVYLCGCHSRTVELKPLFIRIYENNASVRLRDDRFDVCGLHPAE